MHTWEEYDGEEIVRLISARKASRRECPDIFDKPISKRQKAVLARLKATPDAKIDYSDIPPLTSEQLDRMVRGKFYRPAKQLVSVRLEPEIVEWLRDFGPGYLTRVNDILRGVMEQTRARRS